MATIGNLIIGILGNVEGLEQSLGKAKTAVGGFAGGIQQAGGMALNALGGAAVAGAGMAATAITGAAVGGAKAFADFEAGMNEVFTLLPGISDEAMGQMQDDVISFSNKMGVLPEETIPALYQALSAGVPPDNVFAFLEQGQMAAKGGVTDLTTAIDGITSVVNAYGSDVLSAGQASDQMFTAVRLGKTTFGEMAGSLYNVIPTAAATGVEFGSITAALAAMTAQGTPTAVATTQIRQLLVELSKEGSAAATTFEQLAGQSFTEFIASGGDLQGALALMTQAADANGVSVSNMFSSVEAGNAALALTGKGSEAFNTALQAMQDSSGATAAAFDQMNQGGAVAMERLKVTASTTMIQIGEAMQGATVPLTEAMIPALEKFGNWFTETGAPAIKTFVDNAMAWFDEMGGKFKPIMDEFHQKFKEVWEPAQLAITDAINRIKQAMEEMGIQVDGDGIILTAFKGVLDAVVIAVEAFAVGIQLAAGFAEWMADRVNTLKGAFDNLKEIMRLVQEKFSGYWDALNGGIQPLLDALAGLWEKLKSIWDLMKNIIGGQDSIDTPGTNGATSTGISAAPAINHYNLTINTSAGTENVIADFDLMRAMA